MTCLDHFVLDTALSMILRRTNCQTAHLVSRAKGANFAMYLSDMKANGSASAPGSGVERYNICLLLEMQLA